MKRPAQPKCIAIDARQIKNSTGRYSRQLLKYLQELDHENEYHVIIHSDDQGAWQPNEDAENFHLHVVDFDPYTFQEQLGFAKFLYELGADLVHFVMPQQPLLYVGRRVTTIHDLTMVHFQNLDKNRHVYTFEQNVFKFLLKNVAKRSKRVIVPTQYVRDDVAAYARIPKDKITVTYEAAEQKLSGKPKAVNALKKQDFILYVGNAHTHKNLDTLLEGFAKLREKHPDLQLALAGKPSYFYEQLQKKAANMDLGGVHFLGFVDDPQLAWLYKNAKCYVFPSKSEGFGLPGLEAMAYKLPVVSSDATCLPEVYGNAAQYFNPSSAEQLADAVDSVLTDSKLRKKLVTAGTKRLKDFSWKRMAEQTHQAYLDALK